MTDTPKALKDMTWKEARPIFRAFHSGELLSYWIFCGKSQRWSLANEASVLCMYRAYRISPRKPTISPELWAVLPEDVVAIAMDEGGEVYGYECVPSADSTYWSDGLSFIQITDLRGHDFTGVDWKDSLVLRPGSEGEV